MQHILSANEFSIGNVKREAHNQAKCKVVFNSSNPPKDSSTDPFPAVYPPAYPSPDLSGPCLERSVVIEPEPYSIKFYKQIGITLSHILRSNNMKLLVNLIDQSGKIIVDIVDLAKLVALIVDVPDDKVIIKFEELEPSCFARTSPMKLIKNIKINQEDFHMRYNKEYNVLQDEFSISLEKVIYKPELINYL